MHFKNRTKGFCSIVDKIQDLFCGTPGIHGGNVWFSLAHSVQLHKTKKTDVMQLYGDLILGYQNFCPGKNSCAKSQLQDKQSVEI